MVYTNSGIRRLVLASGSPRRRQLLSLLGIPFVIKAAGVDERPLPGEPPSEMVLRVSQAKAFAIGEARPDELVIAADTVVVLDGQPLGKPEGKDGAIRMLHSLRGDPHMVYSGVAVWHVARRHMISELAESVVWMRNYSDGEIDAYVASGDPLDKAGAYAIQHPGFDPVARVEGCWLNVMGLPLCHLARALLQAGVHVPANVPRACQAFN
ncbi:MAG: Maf family protein, partial [Anaerolineae bacterium]